MTANLPISKVGQETKTSEEARQASPPAVINSDTSGGPRKSPDTALRQPRTAAGDASTARLSDAAPSAPATKMPDASALVSAAKPNAEAAEVKASSAGTESARAVEVAKTTDAAPIGEGNAAGEERAPSPKSIPAAVVVSAGNNGSAPAPEAATAAAGSKPPDVVTAILEVQQLANTPIFAKNNPGKGLSFLFKPYLEQLDGYDPAAGHPVVRTWVLRERGAVRMQLQSPRLCSAALRVLDGMEANWLKGRRLKVVAAPEPSDMPSSERVK